MLCHELPAFTLCSTRLVNGLDDFRFPFFNSGWVFFNAGVLKYKSFEFAVKLFEEEYKVPILAPAVAARIAMINELTTSILPLSGARDKACDTAFAGHDVRHPNLCVSERLAGSCAVGIGPHIPAHTWPGAIFDRLSNRALLDPEALRGYSEISTYDEVI